jgi:hypothetical protein
MINHPIALSPTMYKSTFKTVIKPDHEASSFINEKRQRRIHFAVPNDENDSVPSTMTELTDDIINDLWYTEEEITTFKMMAKMIVFSGKVPAGETMAGLERYHDIRRSKYKKSAIFYTLQAQHANTNPDFIMEVSRRCTIWARTVAENQGLEHFCEVYPYIQCYKYFPEKKRRKVSFEAF